MWNNKRTQVNVFNMKRWVNTEIMSLFNANTTDTPMTTLLSNSTIVTRNSSGDRLNENNGSIVVAAATVTNNNTNTTAGMPIATANSFNQDNYTNNCMPNALPMTGVSNIVSDMCSDSEDDYERTTRKIGTHNWIFNYDDVSKFIIHVKLRLDHPYDCMNL